MLWHLIAAIFAGLGAAGVALLLRSIFKQKLPKWIIPAFAGLGMLGYQIYYEYSWFTHLAGLQPESAMVVSSEAGRVFWRPWSYVFPVTQAFTVLDRQSIQTHEKAGAKIVEFVLYRFEKKPIDQVRYQAHLLNCLTRQLAPVSIQTEQPFINLTELNTTHPIFKTLCQNNAT